MEKVHERYCKNAKNLVGWIDQRFPLMSIWNEHIAQYYAPKNFNLKLLWNFFYGDVCQPNIDWYLADHEL